MKICKFYFFVFIALFCTGIKAQSFLNLDFEVTEKADAVGWDKGTGEGFKIEVDTTVGFMSRKSMHIKSVEKRVQAGIIGASFPIEAARGKTIKLSGFIKTEKVDVGWAGLWIGVYGKDEEGKDKVLNFNNMAGRGAKYSEDWKKLSITMKVDEKAYKIRYGVLLVGTGKAWFDYLEFEIDGKFYEDIIPEKK